MLRIILADDEQPVLERMERMLSQIPAVEIVGRFLLPSEVLAQGLVSGAGMTGGLIGVSRFQSFINLNYATADVTDSVASAYAGGLVGKNESIIVNCYAAGSVSATNEELTLHVSDEDEDEYEINHGIGGLVGFNNYGTITSSHAVGNVTSADETGVSIGALVGADQDGTISGSFPNGDADMSTDAVFKAVGWDFPDTWKIGKVTGVVANLACYPVFQWQTNTTTACINGGSNDDPEPPAPAIPSAPAGPGSLEQVQLEPGIDCTIAPHR